MDIRDLLRSLGVPFKEHTETSLASPGWIACPCPYCGRGDKFGLGINVKSLAVSCWKCGQHKLGQVLSDCTNTPLREILPLLPKRGESLDFTPVERVTGKYLPPPEVVPLDHPSAVAHRNYLRKRRIDPEWLAEHYKAGAIAGDGGHYRWRIFLPVLDIRGKPVSWTTRAIGKGVEPRYLSSPPERELVPLKHTVYGVQHIRSRVVICEGPFSSLAVGPGAIATYGLSYTKAQLGWLAKIPSRTVLFDSEPAAQRRAHQLANALACFSGETNIVELSGPDPAESPLEEIAELRARFLD